MFRRISLIAFFVGLAPITSTTVIYLVLAYGIAEISDHADLLYMWFLFKLATMDLRENITRGVQFSEWLMGSAITWKGETVIAEAWKAVDQESK